MMNKEGEDIIDIVKSLEFYTQFSNSECEDKDKIIRIFEDYGFDIDPYAMNEKYLQEFKNTKKCKSNTMEYLSILCCGVDSGKLLYMGEIPYLIGDDPDDSDNGDKPNKVKRYNKIKNGSKFNGLKFQNSKYINNSIKSEVDRDDEKYLFVKCNNPQCKNYFRVNLWELIHIRRLFCCNKCKVKVNRIIPKLIKYNKVCKKCKRPFVTYDNSREYCNVYCEYITTKLTPFRYKEYIKLFNDKRSAIAMAFVNRTDLSEQLIDFDISLDDNRFIEKEIIRLKEAKECFNNYSEKQKNMVLTGSGAKRSKRGKYKKKGGK
ncbi:MAG: hypothetical protein WC877_01930 [Dehalococcoidales bacterium]